MNGGVLDSDNRRYDEILNPLVEEENQMRQEGFRKLNLPEEELLKTETSRDAFPENNKPADPNIKIDKETVSGTLKTAGRSISSGAKKVFAKVSEFRRQQVERRMESGGSVRSGVGNGGVGNGASESVGSGASEGAQRTTMENQPNGRDTESETDTPDSPRITSPLSSQLESGVTHLKDILRKESQLKTIEELKKPELASYPIMSPKTAEAIQKNEEDNVEEEIKEIKKIVEPGVSVAKDLPQPKEDPYVPAATPKPASWARRHGAAAWKATTASSARAWGQLKESGVATQVVLSVVGAGGGWRARSDT